MLPYLPFSIPSHSPPSHPPSIPLPLRSDSSLIDIVLALIGLICAINNIYQTLGPLIQSFITLVMRHDYN